MDYSAETAVMVVVANYYSLSSFSYYYSITVVMVDAAVEEINEKPQKKAKFRRLGLFLYF